MQLLDKRGYDVSLDWGLDDDEYARVYLPFAKEDDREAERIKILQMLEDEWNNNWKRNWTCASPGSLQEIIRSRLQDRRYLVQALLASVITMRVANTQICVERFALA